MMSYDEYAEAEYVLYSTKAITTIKQLKQAISKTSNENEIKYLLIKLKNILTALLQYCYYSINKSLKIVNKALNNNKITKNQIAKIRKLLKEADNCFFNYF